MKNETSVNETQNSNEPKETFAKKAKTNHVKDTIQESAEKAKENLKNGAHDLKAKGNEIKEKAVEKKEEIKEKHKKA